MQLHRLVVAVLLCVGLLAGSAVAQVSRGPYLQTGSDTQVTFRWRTPTATNSRVSYGASPTTLTSHVDDATVTTEHEVVVTGLTANTTYYYSVGSTTAVQAGADANHFVVTAPTPGTSKPTRIWVIGDAGTGSSSQAAVRDAYYSFTGTRHTDLWLQLGDNAYSSGTDSEYQSKMFDVYSAMLKKSVVFPTRGNHESATDGSGNVVYYNIFTLPTAAQAGGVASGTEAYYSFDYGNIHFICLDSFGTSRSSTGAMANWLRNDLANNTKAWTIAYWHHPPYSKGSHNSDTESQLIEMRQNINPILEDGGVDLVLSGHSHSYERSKFIDSHYGLSSTFSDATHVVQAGSGQGAGAYAKASVTPEAHSGTVYAVAGSSGQTSGGTLNHPAHYVSLNNLGSLVLDIDGTRLDATFLRETGATNDSFTVIKSAPTSPPAAPTSLSATAGSSQVTLAWAASAGATSYIVKRATVAGGPYAAIATGVTATSYVDSDVTNGTTYYYVVSAMNAAGESANSNQASATPQGGSPPAAPTNLVATTAGKTKIALAWTDNATNETGFKIEMATTATGPFTQIATVGANATSYTSTGLSRHTTYYYRVRAYGSGGDSTYSNVASATTN